MKKTYKIKAVQRAWIEIEADDSLTQKEIYELAKEYTKKNGLNWEDITFNIVKIDIDDTVLDVDINTKISLLKAIDPLTNKVKESN
jgi:hypothetical protein